MSVPPATADEKDTSLPALVDGTELVGEFSGGGYRVPPQLVYRPDGQVVHLPTLLYLLVKILDGRRQLTPVGGGPVDGCRVLAEVADALTRQTGREFAPEHITFLLDEKLAPLGITTYSDGTPPAVEKANPFLALRFRVSVVPERATWLLGAAFGWLHRPVVLVLAIAAFLASEIWLFGTQSIGFAVQQILGMPLGILLVLVIALASAAFHEIGHVSACRYSGARPGVMGCGIYLVWLAFYTDITDSYRLGRAGRLRTDLGGVYFNALFVLGLTVAYLATGAPVLLVGVLSANLEMVQQLLPTLRFDGYYIVSDLVGVPDLFKYIGPILKRAVLRRPADARLGALKRWPQIVVTVWVLGVLPVLALQLGIIVLRLPDLAGHAWVTSADLLRGALASDRPVLAMLSAYAQIFLLLLPIAGITLLLVQLARTLLRVARNRIGVLRALGDRMPTWARRCGLFVLLGLLLAAVVLKLAPSSSPPPAATPSRQHMVGAAPSTTPSPSPSATRPGAVPTHRPRTTAGAGGAQPRSAGQGGPAHPAPPAAGPGGGSTTGAPAPRSTDAPPAQAPPDDEPTTPTTPSPSPSPLHSSSLQVLCVPPLLLGLPC